MSFETLGLDPALIRALGEEGYTTPTPIQQQAIPVVMTGADLLGIAQTGTGKTAAFALPILHRLAQNRRQPARKSCRALILSPTRELATQIAESFRTYGRHLGIRVAVVFGGVGHRPQIQALQRGVDVLVATPGRLLDHVDSRNIDLGPTEIFVLDEADQMLDLGFVKPIRTIAGMLSQKRQSLFFSATMPPDIGKLADALLRQPTKVSVAPQATTAERVAQKVIHVQHAQKRALLVELLSSADMSRTLVFTRTKRGADRVAEYLERASISVAAIHGNKSQRQRDEAMSAFKASRIRVLVATDIAARGIDIDLVTHVINYELPDVPESYVHRIGRTARAGAEGSAISLVDGEERGKLRDIERLTRRPIPAEAWGDATVEAERPHAARSAPARGGRAPHGERGRGGEGGRGRDARSHGQSHAGHRDEPRRDEARRGEARRDVARRDDQRGASGARREQGQQRYSRSNERGAYGASRGR